MYRIRLHGRGGQDIKMAAHILGRAAFLSGYQTQSFVLYETDMKGSPLTSFVRMDKNEILERGYIFDPDFVICADDTLDMDEVKDGLNKDGFVLINTGKYPGHFSSIKQKVYTIDATKTALDVLGKPVPNTALLGAFVKIFRKIPLETLKKAVEREFNDENELAEKSNKVMEICYNKMRL